MDILKIKSGGLIKGFFKSNIITQDTNIISISSAIFYSLWKYAFDKVQQMPFNGITKKNGIYDALI